MVINILTKNILAVIKLQQRPEKGCDEKCKSKRGQPRPAVDHMNNFDHDDPGHKTLISHFFHHSFSSGLGCNFFTARMFWLGFHFFLRNKCMFL